MIAKDLTDETVLFSRPNTGINFDNYDNIQVELEGQGAPAPISTFAESKLHELLMANILLSRYEKPTPVQKYSLPIVNGGRDLMASAQTGTVSFFNPLLFFAFNVHLQA